MQALSVWTGDRVRHYRVFQDEVCGSSLSSNFFSLFLCKFLIVWQFGCTIHSDPLTSLCGIYFAERLRPWSWWRAMQNNWEANKTLLRLHFTKMWRETYSAYKYIYMDLRLTSDRGPWINQSESAKSFIFKIHHDSCWCCYLILWGVIKRVIFCLGWTIISYKNYCKFSLKRFEALDDNPELWDVLLKASLCCQFFYLTFWNEIFGKFATR